jgi:hypothetical protein
MSSPAFCLIHDNFWMRRIEEPRLTGWNEKDRRRIPEVWSGFVRELNESTNVLWRMEAQVLMMADAPTQAEKGTAFTNLFNLVDQNSDELMTNSFPLFRNNWELDDFFLRGPFYSLYSSSYRSKFETFKQHYSFNAIPQMNVQLLFPQQKSFLQTNTTFDSSEVSRLLFFPRNYTKAQARELQPLIVSYKSNLFARSQVSAHEWNRLLTVMDMVATAENRINRVLDPSAPPRSGSKDLPPRPGTLARTTSTDAAPTGSPATNRQPITTTISPAEAIHKPARIVPMAHEGPAAATKIVVVNKFVELPLAGLPGEHRSLGKITMHQFVEGKLLLNFNYVINDVAQIRPNDDPANYRLLETPSAIAVFDPDSEKLEIIPCPRVDVAVENKFRYRSTIFRGQIYHSNGGEISRYDRKARKWEVLPISNGVNYQLFNVADHLYAADDTSIFEITDSGKSTRLLASTRRNPPVTLLDRQNLGVPLLVEGPNRSLRVIGKDKIFTLMNNDWAEDGAAPKQSWTPQILSWGVLFRYDPDGTSQPDSLSYLATETKAPELLMFQQAEPSKFIRPPDFYHRQTNSVEVSASSWKKPEGLALAKLPAAVNGSDLYLLVDHAQTQNIVDSENVIQMRKISPKGDYHAALLRYSHDTPEPLTVYLRFDSPDGCPPASGIDPEVRPPFPRMPPIWMVFSHQFLILGIEPPERNLTPENNNLGLGYKTGIWLLPLSQLETIAAQKP